MTEREAKKSNVPAFDWSSSDR